LSTYDDQTASDARYVNVTGDTMTGNLGVTGTVTADGLTVDGASSGSTVATFTSNALVNTPLLVFQRIGGAVAGKIAYDDTNTGIAFGTTTNHEVRFLINNSEKMQLNSSGLDVTGSVTADGLTVDGNDSYTSNIKFDYGASAPTYFANWGYKSSSDGNKVFLTITDGGAAKDVLVANYNGHVGIGTDSPATTLHITKDGNQSAVLDAYEAQQVSHNTIAYTRWVQNASGIANIMGVDSAAGILGTSSNHALAIRTNNTERMRIDAIGGLITKPAIGGHAVFNEDGVDADFRVESVGNENMLHVDGGANHVNIGTATDLGGTLNVEGSLYIAETDTPILRLRNTGNSDTELGVNGLGAGLDSFYIAQYAGLAAGEYDFRIVGASREFTFARGGVVNEGGGNSDFRVESSGNENMLFVDGGLNIVSVGSSSVYQSGALEVFAQSDTSSQGVSINGASSATSFRLYTVGDVAKIGRGGDNPAISISTGNAVTINEDNLDADFRVESVGNENMLHVDGGNNVVVVGGTTAETGDTFEVISADATTNVRIRNTNAGATGPILIFDKSSASPANDDDVGDIRFIGKDSGGNAEQYARLLVESGNITSGGEDGITTFNMMVNGTDTNMYTMNHVGTTFNEGGDADLDFRVKSVNKSDMFVVDGGEDSVNVNGGSTTSHFNVGDDGYSTLDEGLISVSKGLSIRNTQLSGSADPTNRTVTFVISDIGLKATEVHIYVSGSKYNSGLQNFAVKMVHVVMEESGNMRINSDQTSNLGYRLGNQESQVGSVTYSSTGGGNTTGTFTVQGEYDTLISVQAFGPGHYSINSITYS